MAGPTIPTVYEAIAKGVSPDVAARAEGLDPESLDSDLVAQSEAIAIGTAEKALLVRVEKGIQSAISFFLCNRAPERWRVSSRVENQGSGNFEDEVE